MQSFGIGSTVKNVFLPNTNPIDPAKQALVFASRKLNANNQLILPVGSTPMPSLYKPFQLAAYLSPIDALIELGKMGFQYTQGLSFNESFPAPDNIITDNVTGLVTLVWNSPSIGLQNLEGENTNGSITQDNSSIISTGTIVSISVVGNQSFLNLVLVNTSPTFTTSNPVVINALLASDAPDPETSDQVCLAAYWFYKQYATAQKFTTSANLWISVTVEGEDASISPSSTPIDLVAPTTATVIGDGSTNLTYPLNADNLGLLPTEYLGQTTVTQGSVVGIFNGYTLTSTTCIINVVNVTGGTFDNIDMVVIIKDASQNGGVLSQEEEISSFALIENVPNLNTLTTTYADFYSLISSLQAPSAAANNKFNVQGYYGYSPATINQYPISSITAPNVNYFKMSARLDIPTSFQYPNLPVVHVMQTLYNNVNSQAPFTATEGKLSILNMTASTNKSTIPSTIILNQLTNQGITAIGALATGQMYVYRDVCTLQSIGGVPDKEFRFEPLQLKTRWLDKNAYLIAEATVTLSDGSRNNNNPEVITSMTANLKQLLSVGVQTGMLGNTNNTVSVIVNPDDVSRLLINITTSIVPTNAGSDITVYVTSFSV